jgi:hypothetical protein
VVWRILSTPSAKRIARGLEEKFPELKDDVTNSLLLSDQLTNGSSPNPVSKGLITAHLRKTVKEISSIHPRQVVNLKKALVHLRVLLPLIGTCLVVLAVDPAFLSRSLGLIIHPFSNMPNQKTVISVTPKGSVVLRGSPLVINAVAKEYVPKSLALAIWPEEGQKEMGDLVIGYPPFNPPFASKPIMAGTPLRFTALGLSILLTLER